MTGSSFQNDVPKGRVNIRLDLHTGGALKALELPLKLMVLGDFSNGQDTRPLSERPKIRLDRHNFDSVLGELSPSLRFEVTDALAGEGDLPVQLNFAAMKDFEPEQVARQVPKLRALLAMRNLLRDLRSNVLDNATFRRELERIISDAHLSESLRHELTALPSRR